MSIVAITSDKDTVLLPVRVHPGARGTRVAGTRNGMLLVNVAAPPTEGAANAALVAHLAAMLKCPKRSVVVARGQRSREKTIRLSGLSIEAVRTRLEDVLSASS